MRESLGARLRRRREEQGVRLCAIADHTKIKLSLLEALERDDVSQWPTGIFRRAYIRAYAQAINLDPDAAVRDFLSSYPEPQEVFETAMAAALAAGERTAPPTRLRNIVGSALESLSRLRRPPAAPGADEHPAVLHASAAEAFAAFEVPAIHPPELLGAMEMVDDAPEPGTSSATDIEMPPAVAAAEPEIPAPPSTPDFAEIARVCTILAQIDSAERVQRPLAAAAAALEAVGLIVWIWDDAAEGLRPALAHGYSPRILVHLPTVSRGDDNLTAAAFRSERMCSMTGGEHSSAALAVPVLTPYGCAGVLALELVPGAEQQDAVRAAAAIIAAALAGLVTRSAAIEPEVQPFEMRRAQ
jgi:transcriptional regulator with XRE-family HTH domain